MKVSIIIPIYNVERYLKECLNSAVNQTLKDIEIICVNDGSTDKSLDIIKDYEKLYKNVRIINQENKGLSSARNSGLKVATGEYIYFLDSDDYIELTCIEECYYEAKNNDLDIVTFDAEWFYDSDYNGEFLEQSFDRSKMIDSQVRTGEDFYIYANSNNAYRSPVWLNLYKRKFIEENKLYFYEGIIHEDELHSSTSFMVAKRVKYIDKKFFNRRIRNNSIMTTKFNKQRIDGTLIIAEESYKLYLRNNLKNKTKEILLKWISLYYSNSITGCDLLELSEKRREIIKKIYQKPEVININLSIQIEVPTLFYNKVKV